MRERETGFRFNMLDVTLLLLALFCLLGVFQRANLQGLFESDKVLEEYSVTFEVEKMRSTTVDLLEKGTVLYLAEPVDGAYVTLGSLSEGVSTSAATVYLQDKDGNTVKAVYPQDSFEYLLDVSGRLDCRGVMEGGSFLLSGKTYLAVNQTVLVRTERADFQIRITGIAAGN